MTQTEIALINRAIELLHSLIDEPRPADFLSRHCLVTLFATRYLSREPGNDMTSGELWQFYTEIAAAGELEPLSKSEFMRRLPGAMESVFGVKKCHSIKRDERTMRGFKSITIREAASY